MENLNNPKEQAAYLREKLNELIKAALNEETIYQTMTSLALGSAKDDKNILQQQSASKKRKEALEIQIRHTRSLIEKIEKGEYQI